MAIILLDSESLQGPDQTLWISRLVCAFVVHMLYNKHKFSYNVVHIAYILMKVKNYFQILNKVPLLLWVD